LFACGLFACTEALQHDLSEEEANEIYALLNRNGILARKKRGDGDVPTYVISVPKTDTVNSVQLLTDHSLPRVRAEGLSLFKNKKGMIPTQTEERAMFLEALGGEISNTLNRIPGVLEARTLVMLPESNDLVPEAERPRPSAAVFIKYRLPPEESKPGETPRPRPVEEEAVKRFVSAGVPNLAKEAVQVLMVQGASPEAELREEERFQTIMGVRVAEVSADRFRFLVFAAAGLVLVMLALCIWIFLKSRALAKEA